MKRETIEQERKRFKKELAVLTKGMVRGSKEWMEQWKWLNKKFNREEIENAADHS